MKNLTIALVQMESEVGKIDINLSKIKKYVDEAALHKVDIICFPELSVTGYCPKNSPKYAEIIPGVSSKILSQWAQDMEITILAGICEKNHNLDPYITHLICMANGNIFTYRKTHLAPHELSFFTPGDELPIFEIPQVRFGIEICWELNFPQITTFLSLQGAELVFCPYASARTPKDRQQTWHIFLPARAYDNRIFIASCNALGQDFGGGLMVCDPEGQIVVEDYQGKESMIIVNLDSSIIEKIRNPNNNSLFQSYYPKFLKNDLFKKE
ncbi:MAG: nitrilase [Candidatus Atribacteria bacterium]|nr:nitrilase [Candidatus Atribacteria bacterium]